jgi:uncharacterized protein (TIGR03067 family)
MKRSLRGMAVLLCVAMAGSHAVGDGGERTDNAEIIVAGQLRGTWTVESFEIMGMNINPAMMGQQMSITFDNGKVVMKDGMRREESTYKLDDSKTPKAIDITSPPNQGNQMIKGIYKIESNTLKIAFPATGPMNVRPTSFDGKDVGIMILKRTKG